MNALQTIQQKLKAPKSCYNNFGKYSYRNLEDILEAVKPLLTETNSYLTISDEIVEIGGVLFLKATAELQTDRNEDDCTVWSVSAYAMHAKDQKGMNEAQITGATSSYARKYALNGLFMIDDTKDSDATNDGKKDKVEAKQEAKNPAKEKAPITPKAELTPTDKSWSYCVTKLRDRAATIEIIKKSFVVSPENETLLLKEAGQPGM